MKIIAIQLQNIRGFQNVPKTDLSEGINIFIGANNSGKTTLLNSIFQLQRQVLYAQDITIGRQKGKVELFFSGFAI
jgi:AAA15 family ATPase/GTPase